MKKRKNLNILLIVLVSIIGGIMLALYLFKEKEIVLSPLYWLLLASLFVIWVFVYKPKK